MAKPTPVGRGWTGPEPGDLSRRDRLPSRRELAADALALAQMGGMPDSFWLTDSRIARACQVLGIGPQEALDTDWAPPSDEWP